MTATFLENILAQKQTRVIADKASANIDSLREKAFSVRGSSPSHLLRAALKNDQRNNIIAEIKRASPSKGVINDVVDVTSLARQYERGGACAISVLTEEDFFNGSIADLSAVRGATSLPLLRKDFIFDEFQIYEAAAAGADAILLIVAALEVDDLERLHQLAECQLGMDALVEVHDRNELGIAAGSGCSLIGVNNRNLSTFEVSLDVSRNMIEARPNGAVLVAESGINRLEHIAELKSLGFNGFLIGETLMRHGDPQGLLEAWV
ncbi:MAG TPA: indole-3-glycerol phosphate synthase TrpC [Pyrinomonadaceae bacterium]|nr:indole-3-glycerol phosphate synthase TrpC [Pyrinomonadaceae bacterium]